MTLSSVGSTAVQPFQGIPFPSPMATAHGGLVSPLLQFPGMYSGQPDLRHFSLSQYQAVNQAAFASELSKMKSPFINRNYLELAMLVCNTFRGKLFPCPHCRYVTDRRNNLKRHISTMHQTCDKVLECCGVHFNTKASLREHIMIFHHNGYSCAYCGRRFCRKALLKRHLSVHSGQKDYTCPHCDYATSHKSNLERHKRIHDRFRISGDEDDDDVKNDVITDPTSSEHEFSGLGSPVHPHTISSRVACDTTDDVIDEADISDDDSETCRSVYGTDTTAPMAEDMRTLNNSRQCSVTSFCEDKMCDSDNEIDVCSTAH